MYTTTLFVSSIEVIKNTYLVDKYFRFDYVTFSVYKTTNINVKKLQKLQKGDITQQHIDS